MKYSSELLQTSYILLMLSTLLIWCTSCTSESSLAGEYQLLVQLDHDIETLSLQEDRTYRYYYRRSGRTFRNEGTWRMERKNGYVYAVFDNWRMRRQDCLSREQKSAIASFDVDGDVLWLIKDLPECAYKKVN